MTSNNYIEFWNETLRQIKNDLINENRLQEYEMWFDSAQYLEDDGSTIKVALPSIFLKDHFINRKYDQKLINKMKELTGKTFNFIFEIKNNEFTPTQFKDISDEIKYTPEVQIKNSTPINTPITSENFMNENKHPDLNPSYTFNSFVPGDNISFAYNAALSVSRNINNVNKAYNPLLLHGGVGL